MNEWILVFFRNYKNNAYSLRVNGVCSYIVRLPIVITSPDIDNAYSLRVNGVCSYILRLPIVITSPDITLVDHNPEVAQDQDDIWSSQ